MSTYKVKSAIAGSIIAAVAAGAVLSGTIIQAMGDNSYKGWKQYGASWSSISLGDSGETVASSGCAVTSAAILMVKSGSVTDGSFTPGTLAAYMNANGGYSSGGSINWNKLSGFAPSFVYCGKHTLSGSQEEKAAQMKALMDQGYYLMAVTKSGGHFVAVDAVNGSEVTMMDPGSRSSSLFGKYAASGVISVCLFKGANSTAAAPAETIPAETTEPIETTVMETEATETTVLFTTTEENATETAAVSENVETTEMTEAVTETSTEAATTVTETTTAETTKETTTVTTMTAPATRPAFQSQNGNPATTRATTAATTRATTVATTRATTAATTRATTAATTRATTAATTRATTVATTRATTVATTRATTVATTCATTAAPVTAPAVLPTTAAPAETTVPQTEAETTTVAVPAETVIPSRAEAGLFRAGGQNLFMTVRFTTTDNLHLREKPDTGSDILLVIPEGTALDVVEINDDFTWGRVAYNGKEGWISIDFADL